MKFKIIFLGFAVSVLLSLTACVGNVNGVPEPRPEAQSSVAHGQRLLVSYGCGSCHSIPGVPGADAMAGPPLDRFYERTYIAGKLPNTEDNLIQWIQDPQKVVPGNAMPNLGVSAEDARDMAAYLYNHQPGIGYYLESTR